MSRPHVFEVRSASSHLLSPSSLGRVCELERAGLRNGDPMQGEPAMQVATFKAGTGVGLGSRYASSSAASPTIGALSILGAERSRLSRGGCFAHSWLSLGTMLFIAAALSGCGGNGAVAPMAMPPVRAPVQPTQALDPLQLGEWVAGNVTENDFREPFAVGLELDLRGDVLFLRGVVDETSDDQIYDVLRSEFRIGNLVFTMVPGSVDDDTNLALGRMLRQAGVTTFLPSRGTVASGGTDLFLSGARRIVERGGRVGVHSWGTDDPSVPSAISLPTDHPVHARYLDYYRDMGIPEDFYWFTLRAAPPDGMHWMSEEEMAQYRIYTDLIP